MYSRSCFGFRLGWLQLVPSRIVLYLTRCQSSCRCSFRSGRAQTPDPLSFSPFHGSAAVEAKEKHRHYNRQQQIPSVNEFTSIDMKGAKWLRSCIELLEIPPPQSMIPPHLISLLLSFFLSFLSSRAHPFLLHKSNQK